MNYRFVALIGAMLVAGFLATPAQADGRIGYVDMQRVIAESAAGKRAKADLEGMAKQKQEQVARESQKLKALQQALEKEQLTLTETQKRTKQRDFEQKVQAYQQLAGDAQRELSQKEAEHFRTVLVGIRDIIREIAKGEKLMLVLEKNEQPVLYAEDGPDLTDRVIKAYDAKSKR